VIDLLLSLLTLVLRLLASLRFRTSFLDGIVRSRHRIAILVELLDSDMGYRIRLARMSRITNELSANL
jgi:hypothetical protein